MFLVAVSLVSSRPRAAAILRACRQVKSANGWATMDWWVHGTVIQPPSLAWWLRTQIRLTSYGSYADLGIIPTGSHLPC